MKEKVNKLEENSKNKNIREMYKGINEFMKGYQPRAYVITSGPPRLRSSDKHDSTIVADRTNMPALVQCTGSHFFTCWWLRYNVLFAHISV